jgi:predicted amidohydrolase YtcJ
VGGWVIEQAITAKEALSNYSASVSFQLTGIRAVPLQIGQPCDFVVLSENPFEVGREQIRGIEVLATFKAGQKISGR